MVQDLGKKLILFYDASFDKHCNSVFVLSISIRLFAIIDDYRLVNFLFVLSLMNTLDKRRYPSVLFSEPFQKRPVAGESCEVVGLFLFSNAVLASILQCLHSDEYSDLSVFSAAL